MALDWLTAGANILGGLGGFFGSDAKTYIPRSGTKNSIRNNLNALTFAMFGPHVRAPGDGPVTRDQMTGGLYDLFMNPENYPYMRADLTGFAPINKYESALPAQYGDFANYRLPHLLGNYSDAMGQALQGGNIGGLGQTLTGNFDRLNQALSQGPNQAFGNASTQSAIGRMLSGDLDLNLFQGAIDEYLQPAMEQFNEQLLPSFQRADNAATSGLGSAGALKASQRTMEQIGEGLGAHLGGRLFDASQAAANRMGQGVGLAQGYDALNLDSRNQHIGNLLAASGLGGQLTGAGDQLFSSALRQFPEFLTMNTMPMDMLAKAGTAQRATEDPYAAFHRDREMYNRSLPYQLLPQFYGLLQNNPAFAGYGVNPAPSSGSNLLSGLAGILGQDWSGVFGGGGGGGGGGGNIANGMVPIDYGTIFGTTGTNSRLMFP